MSLHLIVYDFADVLCAEFTETIFELLSVMVSSPTQMCTFFHELGHGCARVRSNVQVIMNAYAYLHACRPRQRPQCAHVIP